MKNSTRKNSYELGGLVFFPVNASKLPYKVYRGVQSWIKAGRESPAYIHDSFVNLHVSGVPVVDAVFVAGVFTRTKIGKPKKGIKVLSKDTVATYLPKVQKTVAEIKSADTKEHHVMSY